MPPQPDTRTRPAANAPTRAQPLSIITVAAIAFGLAAVWVFPLFTGALALIFAVISVVRRHRLADKALIVAIVGPVVGFLLHLLPESFLQ